jgi:hypothetical protein
MLATTCKQFNLPVERVELSRFSSEYYVGEWGRTVILVFLLYVVLPQTLRNLTINCSPKCVERSCMTVLFHKHRG